MSPCGGTILKEGSRKRQNIEKRTCLKNGRRQHKKKKEKKRNKIEQNRRTCSSVGKTAMVTNNDYTSSCIQPTNQRRRLKRKRSEKIFRGKSDCSANGCGQVLKLQSILTNQFASLLGRSGEGAVVVSGKAESCRQEHGRDGCQWVYVDITNRKLLLFHSAIPPA